MPLIVVPQHTPEDLAVWARLEREDAAWPRDRLARLATRAMDCMRSFAANGPCYLGTSWGKDSCVIAHMAWALREADGITIPVAWVSVNGRENPHCPKVRDAFLARWPVDYHEIECDAEDHVGGLTSGAGFRMAAERFGPRRITGLRADESGARKRRMDGGLVQGRSCAPLGHWTARDVYAYLHAHDLPVHPAYAMSLGGALCRDRLRVASLGGQRGRGFGRAEWEARYYPATSPSS